MIFFIEFTLGARQDLLKIYSFIKSDGRPETAKRLYSQLTKACESLSENPERGHVPVELKNFPNMFCKQINVSNYRIIYQVFDKTVLIQGIIDGRRNVRETLQQRLSKTQGYSF